MGIIWEVRWRAGILHRARSATGPAGKAAGVVVAAGADEDSVPISSTLFIRQGTVSL